MLKWRITGCDTNRARAMRWNGGYAQEKPNTTVNMWSKRTMALCRRYLCSFISFSGKRCVIFPNGPVQHRNSVNFSRLHRTHPLHTHKGLQAFQHLPWPEKAEETEPESERIISDAFTFIASVYRAVFDAFCCGVPHSNFIFVVGFGRNWWQTHRELCCYRFGKAALYTVFDEKFISVVLGAQWRELNPN